MKIIWIGGDRLVPDHGVVVNGRDYYMDDAKARSFIKQGLAEEVKPMKPSKEEVK